MQTRITFSFSRVLTTLSTGRDMEQESSSVSSSNWSNMTTGILDEGTTKALILDPPTGNRYYRLHKP